MKDIERRLGLLEAKVPPPRGHERAEPPWLRWLTVDELRELVDIYETCVDNDAPPEMVQRAEAIYAASISRMEAGEPDYDTKRRLEREAEMLERRRAGTALPWGYDPRTDPEYCGPPLDANGVPIQPQRPSLHVVG